MKKDRSGGLCRDSNGVMVTFIRRRVDTPMCCKFLPFSLFLSSFISVALYKRHSGVRLRTECLPPPAADGKEARWSYLTD